MTFEVRLTRPAIKALDAQRIRRGMRVVAEDPRRRRSGADIKRLHAEPGVYRLRVGDHRVFYVIFPGEQAVYVTDVRHRSRAYD